MKSCVGGLRSFVTQAVSILACLLLGSHSLQGQALSEDFDAGGLPGSWTNDNNSQSTGSNPQWFNGNTSVFTPASGAGYIAANFNATGTAAPETISLWLISPVVNIANGAQIRFQTRCWQSPQAYPDRLQLRLNTTNSGVNCGTLPLDVGDFTMLALDINPTYSTTAYPGSWTEQTYTVSGVTGTVSGRFAFRYFVENGGFAGTNSDYIGVDAVRYLPPPGNPEIEVRRSGSAVLSGDRVSNVMIASSGSTNVSFDVFNLGASATLNCTGVTYTNLSGAVTGVTSSTSLPLNVSAGANSPLVASVSVSGGGDFSFQMTIASNDTDEASYLILVSGFAGTGGYRSPNLLIPDAAPGITDSLTISGGPSAISNLRMRFDISHSYSGDISVYLCPPGLTWTGPVDATGVPVGAINISTQNGGAGMSYLGTAITQLGDTVFDPTSAAVAIATGVAPFTGTFTPEDTTGLQALYGSNPNGTWTIAVFDDVAGDIGILNSWSIEVAGAMAGGGPTVTINQGATQADPTSTSPIVFDVVFSAAVSGFGTGDVTLGGTATGTLVGAVSGSGTTYTVSVTGMTGTGTVIATIGAGVCTATTGGQANQASTSTDNTVTWNQPAGGGPTVTINQGATQADPTGTAPIVFDVVFSAAVSGFATGDVTLSGTAGGTLVGTVAGSGTTYTVSVSGMTTNGTVIATIGAGVCTATTGGQANQASTSTDNTVTWNGGGGSALTIITTTLPNGTVSTAYNATITSTGGTGPFTWTLQSGSLPPGLTLNTASVGATTTLSGTPTSAGTFNFVVQVADSAAASDTQNYSVTVSTGGGGGTIGGGGGGGGCSSDGSQAPWFALAGLLAALVAARRMRRARQ